MTEIRVGVGTETGIETGIETGVEAEMTKIGTEREDRDQEIVNLKYEYNLTTYKNNI